MATRQRATHGPNQVTCCRTARQAGNCNQASYQFRKNDICSKIPAKKIRRSSETAIEFRRSPQRHWVIPLPKLNCSVVELGLSSDLKRTFVTVIGSSVEIGQPGQKSLTLWTKERGPICFVLTRKAVEILRGVLAEVGDGNSVKEPADGV